MLGALRNLRCAKEMLREGGAIDGFHVEGPHISPDDGPRGAHPRRWVRPPDLDEFRRWQEATGNQVRIVTLAPDWPQSLRYSHALHALGQRRASRLAAPSQLPLGATGGRPPDGGFHRGRYPSAAFFPEGCAARQDRRALRAGDRRRGARRLLGRPARIPVGSSRPSNSRRDNPRHADVGQERSGRIRAAHGPRRRESFSTARPSAPRAPSNARGRPIPGLPTASTEIPRLARSS
jgi:hypothetical protein